MRLDFNGEPEPDELGRGWYVALAVVVGLLVWLCIR